MILRPSANRVRFDLKANLQAVNCPSGNLVERLRYILSPAAAECLTALAHFPGLCYNLLLAICTVRLLWR